jgi:hypothetical protein
MKSDALGKLFPSPEELNSRIRLITHLTGRHPNITKLYRAMVHYNALLAIREGKPIPWEKLDPIAFLTQYAPSIGGERANQAVEIARAAPKEPLKDFWGWFTGKK